MLRQSVVAFFCALVAALCAFTIASPIHAFATQRGEAKADYVMSMQRCKGSKVWTNHGLWPEWGQDYRGEAFSMTKLAPIMDELKMYWPSCPEFGHTHADFLEHEWTKHGTVYAQRWNATLLQYFAKGLELREELVSKCSPTLTGECRIKLDKDLKPIN